MKKQQQQPTYFYIHFLGANQVGKTTILNIILNNTSFKQKEYQETKNVNPMHQKFDNHNIYYYDTPGNKDLLNQIQFLSLSNMIVLVYDKSDQNTIQYFNENILELLKIQANQQCKIVLCGNKSDLRQSTQIQNLKFRLISQIQKLRLTVQEFSTSCKYKQDEGLKKIHQYFKKQSAKNGWSILDQSHNSQLNQSFISQNNDKKQIKRKNNNFLRASFAQKGLENVPIPQQNFYQVQQKQKPVYKTVKQSQIAKQSQIIFQKKTKNQNLHKKQLKSSQNQKNNHKPEHYDSAIMKNDQRKIQAELRKSMKIQKEPQEQIKACGGKCQIM